MQHKSPKICRNCGRSTEIKRIDKKYIKQEIMMFLGMDGGFLYTIKALIFKPKQSLKIYFYRNRGKFTRPIKFFLISCLIYTLFIHLFGKSIVEIPKEIEKGSYFYSLFVWVQDNIKNRNILIGLCVSVWVRLFFKREKYNIYEILVMLCYIFGLTVLILSVGVLIFHFFKHEIVTSGFDLGIFFYSAGVIGYIFGGKFKHYALSVIAYLMGYFSFWAIMVLLSLVLSVSFE